MAQERERVELDLANTKKEVVEAVEVAVKFSSSMNFMIEKDQVVVDFQKSEEFFTLCQDFGQESYDEDFNKEEQEL